MPEIASMREDFPALCQPMTAMAGISISTSALGHGSLATDKEHRKSYVPKSADPIEKLEHPLPSGSILWV
jgi:hypothetical protein